MAGGRVDEVPDNVFKVSGRINSTWGGNLTDMVRSRRILEIIESDNLIETAAAHGDDLGEGIRELTRRHGILGNPRGLGIMRAVTLPDGRTRDRILARLMEEEKVLMLGCGERSIRFRPPLTVSSDDIAEALDAFERVVSSVEKE